MLTKRAKRLLLLLWLPLAALIFAACGSEEEGGGGLTEGTPMGTEELPGLPTAEVTPMEEVTSEVTSTEEITGTSGVTTTMDVTETEEITGTSEVTGTLEVVETPTVEAAEEPSEEPPTSKGEETIIVPASVLVNMGVQDGSGTEIGIVAEALVDKSGAVQYVMVDLLPSPEVTGTGEIGELTTVAVPWNSFEVGAQPSILETEEITGTEEVTPTEAGEENGPVSLVYTGAASLESQPVFDLQILDEQGYVLDDIGTEADEMPVPSEYVDLLQIGEYGEYEVLNTEGEVLGSGDEVLVNLTDGQIAYLVIDVGGFLGIGAKSTPIPWERLQLEVTFDNETETEVLTLDATTEMLEDAPEIELDDWSPRVEAGWDAEFRDYWGTQGTDES